jgi:hypothetical protein
MAFDFSHVLNTASMATPSTEALQGSIQRLAAARKRSTALRSMLEELFASGGPGILGGSSSVGPATSSGRPASSGGGRGGITVGSVSGLSPAEAYIIQHESGGRPTAKNPTSTAFGIWQGLQGTRNDYARRLGVSPNTTDVNQQLAMFRAYIRDRYGTAENAQRFWQSHHWY